MGKEKQQAVEAEHDAKLDAGRDILALGWLAQWLEDGGEAALNRLGENLRKMKELEDRCLRRRIEVDIEHLDILAQAEGPEALCARNTARLLRGIIKTEVRDLRRYRRTAGRGEP